MVTPNFPIPLVSVVIPAYNHEKFIGPAIDSVLAQTCSDFELIVIDDGSTDRTGDVVKSYQDPRLSYYFQENQDAYNTINRGLGMARGRYIAILNSDDVYSPDRLQILTDYCEREGAQCVFTDVVPISDSGEVFTDTEFGWNVWHRKNRNFYFQCNDVFTAFLKGNFMVTTSNLFMTREAVAKVGQFCSLRYLHDYDYIFRIMLTFPGGVHYLADEKLLSYRIHDGNTLGEAAIVGREQDQALIAKYMQAAVPEEYRRYIEAGADRLIELGNELHDVRVLLNPKQNRGVKNAMLDLFQAVKLYLQKKSK